MLLLTPSVSSAEQGVIDAAITAAATVCRARGVEFTEVRRSLLEALWRAHQPLGAYDLLPHLAYALGRRFGPTTVYRGLEFLRSQGFIARIETLNAYVACAYQDHAHACIFFVCTCCGNATEMENPVLEQLLIHDAGKLGFEVNRKVIEIEGTCAQCRVIF